MPSGLYARLCHAFSSFIIICYWAHSMGPQWSPLSRVVVVVVVVVVNIDAQAA